MAGLFDDILNNDQTLIKNENALEFEFLPRDLPHRDSQIATLASAIKPLFADRTGKNLILNGIPGIGKTATTKFVLREMQEADENEDIETIYVNCWLNNTSFKVVTEMCEYLGYKFTQNKKTTELFSILKNIVNKKKAVFVFDEIDKSEDYDFLYYLIEGVFKKSIFVITNDKNWLITVDERVRSRLQPELLMFNPYTTQETFAILKSRTEFAFHNNVWNDDLIMKIASHVSKTNDLRKGIFLLKQSGLAAESRSSKTIEEEDVTTAINKLEEFSIKNSDDLEEETKFILDIVKEKPGSKIGDLFTLYKEKGGMSSYKTFQRKIARLGEGKFVSLEKKTGEGGNTTIVNKTLNEY